MNLKIDGQHLCFKISSVELNTLLLSHPISNQIKFNTQTLCITITPTNLIENLFLNINSQLQTTTLDLKAPLTRLNQLKDLGKSREGIIHTQNHIKLQLQVDLRPQQ